jgi:FKBP-type peptidyl-prolyl cis-trans isomerase (trigger factor)
MNKKNNCLVFEEVQKGYVMKKRSIVVCITVLSCLIFTSCIGNRGKINIKEYIRLGNYRGITVHKSELETVSEEMIEERLFRDTGFEQDIYVDTERTTVETGDRITIDLAEKRDGVIIEEGIQKDVSILVGSSHLVEGFQEQIIGHMTGETFDVEITYPDGNENDSAGQTVVYEVTIHSIQELESSLKEEKEKIRKELEEEALEVQRQDQYHQIESYLLEHTEVLKEPWPGQSVQTLIVKEIARRERLALSDDEMEEKLQQYAVDHGYADLEELMDARVGLEQVEQGIQSDIVMEWLLDHAKLTE